MLTKITIRNFKRFKKAEVELSDPVVFIGPNNSGKTSAMQALCLWDIGVKHWNGKFSGRSVPKQKPSVVINRKDLLAIPHPRANLLWRSLRVRNVQRIEGGQQTHNIRIEIVVEAVQNGKSWKCGLEFDYANEESFYCRPLRINDAKDPERMPIPQEASSMNMAFLPPMSGLSATETKLEQGAVNVRIGEGRTAEVLRNLCLRVYEEDKSYWGELVERIEKLFGAQLEAPKYIQERSEIVMGYKERGISLDLSSSGRGLQQTLLILTYMAVNPNAVILLDEPDAHLEILRQREIYNLICDMASNSKSQIIAASHSEVLMKEAAGKHLVVAFVGGRPHAHIGKGNTEQIRKSLTTIGFDQYHQAEMKGWVLYLEGPTDLAVLQALSRRLGKDKAAALLEGSFVRYVGNHPEEAKKNFYGLREGVPELKGIAILDHMGREDEYDEGLKVLYWQQREIENYICTRKTLEVFAWNSVKTDAPGPIFANTESERRLQVMQEAIDEVSAALQTLGKEMPWSDTVKASEDFLAPLFEKFYAKLEMPNAMRKKTFYELASHIPEEEIDAEVSVKLDAIVKVAHSAHPATDDL